MKTRPLVYRRSMPILHLSGLAWACAPALAQGPATAADAAARYQQERAVCRSGQSPQDPATCLREAAAAQAQRRKGDAPDDAASWQRNALQRCDGLPGDDRKACVARIQGQGTVSGSVSSGGVLRELVVTEPTPPRK